MQNTSIINLLNNLPEINLTGEIPYSILNPLYNRISQKELAHSEIIASFLNPNDYHNHGVLFLNQFLNDIGLKDEAKNLSKFDNINIYTERKVKISEDANLRPIDILITWEYENCKNAIIIENKLNYAPDQPDQLNDYYEGVIREGYNVKKVIYMHIDQYIIKTKKDVSNDVFTCLFNYNVSLLIETLKTCKIKKSYSYITEYINLLKNNIQNYKYMETALKIQKDLIDKQEEFKKLVAVSKIVNSKEWHIAKFDIIQSDLVEGFVNDDQLIIGDVNKSKAYNSYYKSLYFKDQTYWLELWSDEDSVNLYLCCKDEDSKVLNEIKFGDLHFKYESNWDNWQYYNTDGSCIDFPSDLESFKELVRKALNQLKNLKATNE
ncbi:PD-(D/E)XK nuclease family protein [Polaribacter sp. Q13]|uniref:PD-(D/E)XK nuclease family protein n=1 Tax=Polaribacter sp. Q13 TaxID=2806551 RepID=UPI00193C7152|nr:PD-(D/E)XK nuclease family protein [Polaribacter sp. Q13]QVY67110.1 PD-(D/E)XK nuclease family protein [Polaribacter sp. Q13]